MSGARYARADHGPVIDRHELLVFSLKADGTVMAREGYYGGEILEPGARKPKCSLDDSEIEIIKRTAEFANTFKTAKAISDYSHSLHAWKDLANGDIISYRKYGDEVNAAVSKRLAAIGGAHQGR